MLEFPMYACFFLRPSRGGEQKWSAAAFAKMLGARLLTPDEASRSRGGDAIADLERAFARCLAEGEEVAIETAKTRKEEIGHLKNLARKAFLTPIEISPDDYAPEDRQGLAVTRVLPDTWKPWIHGPFDVIGDVHDCADELRDLLLKLGYREGSEAVPERTWRHPEGRRIVFVGDFTDRGPQPVETLRIVMAAARGGALAVIGNHDKKLLDYLNSGKMSSQEWFARTAAAIARLPAEERAAIATFLAALPSHLVLDDEKLVVAHAGCQAPMQGRDNEYVREFCMYGEGSGSLDRDGYPIRIDWAADYRGEASVVYGHTTVSRPRWNKAQNAVCIDTGCCLGGELTALRWPEKNLVSVPARRTYTELVGFPRRAA